MRRVPTKRNGLAGELRDTLPPPRSLSVVPQRLALPLSRKIAAAAPLTASEASSSSRRAFRPSVTRISWSAEQQKLASREHEEAEREMALLALLDDGQGWYEPSRLRHDEALKRGRRKLRALSRLHRPIRLRDRESSTYNVEAHGQKEGGLWASDPAAAFTHVVAMCWDLVVGAACPKCCAPCLQLSAPPPASERSLRAST